MARTNEPLKISGIRRDGGTQMRVSLDEATIERYAEDMRNNRWEWGPHNYLVVFHDKSERPEGVYWLADGFHRIEAAQRAGWASVKCRVEDGGRRDAVLLAAGANASHGLSRSRDDVQRAIRALLLDDEWRKWSNRAIAEKVRCDHKTVGSLREKLIASGEIPHEEERTFIRNGATQTQAAPPPPPARPAGAPSVAEYEAAVKSLASCGHALICSARTDHQRGCPPYWIVDPKGAPKRFNTWAEAETWMDEIATETPLTASTDYEAMIAVANNAPALTHLRLTIAADKTISNERNDALQLAINQRIMQLESPAAQPAGESMAAELERVADPKAAPKAERITIQTSDGPTKVIPIFKTEHIALVPFAGSYSITHLETGAKIGPEIKDRHLAEQRFILLADLDWSAGLTDELRTRAREICGLSNEPENIRFSQLQTRATACGCSIVTYHNRRGLLRKGQEIVATGSLDLDHLENIIAGVEGADRIADLTTRAARFNYSFTPHGGKWRLMRDKTPMGAVNDLDELEQSVKSWEQAQERAQQAEEPAAEPEQAEEPEQVAPAAPADEKDVQLQHFSQTIAGLMDKATDDELRALYFALYDTIPDGYEGEDWREDMWEACRALFRTALPREAAWVLGEAVPQ